MKPFYEEPNKVIYQGHALDVLKGLPSESVDCVITSPPYWGLRSYKTEPIIWGDNNCEHEWGIEKIVNCGRNDNAEKGGALFHGTSSKVYAGDNKASQGNFCLKCGAWKGELGLEPTIELYISHLLQIFDEVKRVLKKMGTLWVNIGDSYASGKGTCFNPSGGKGSFSGHGDRKDAGAYPLDRGNISMLKAEGLLPKSLCLIPERFALGMVERGWLLRNNIIWYKPNPMPESVKDRFTGSYEYLYFFTKAQRYWFEQQFDQYTEPLNRWGGDFTKPTDTTSDVDGVFAVQEREGRNRRPNELGRNKRDVWQINTQPYPEAHFAVFPEKLVEIPILAGCPSAICKKCGRAREKIYEVERLSSRPKSRPVGDSRGKSASDFRAIGQPQQGCQYLEIKAGDYTDCGCNAGFESGVVLDLFAGAGTTGAVAKRLGRKYIGIELSSAYCKLHIKRLQGIPMPMELVV